MVTKMNGFFQAFIIVICFSEQNIPYVALMSDLWTGEAILMMIVYISSLIFNNTSNIRIINYLNICKHVFMISIRGYYWKYYKWTR